MLTTIFYRNIEQSLKTQSIEHETESLEAKVEKLEDTAKSFMEEMNLAKFHLPIKEIIREDGAGFNKSDEIRFDEWKTHMEMIFSSSVRGHGDIYQLRYIDAEGREQIHIDSVDGIATMMDSEELLNQSYEPYFKEAVNLPEGEIYLSSIKLNGKPREIQSSLVPVMLAATPVYDERDKVAKGIIVLNMYADSFLEDISRSPNRSRIILSDQDGNYIMHPDTNKIFSSELESNANYFVDQPGLMKDVDLFSKKINYDADKKQFRIWEKVFYDGKTSDRYWIITSITEEVDLLGPVFVLRGFLTSAWLIISIFTLIIAFLLAISISAPIQKLTKIIEEISKGNLKADIDPKLLNSSSETGKLAHAFNRTLVGLKLAMDQADKKEKLMNPEENESDSDSDDSKDSKVNIKIFK